MYFFREEVKFSRPKKPRKGGAKKSPTKQNNEVVSYDLTNVSIFKQDESVVPIASSVVPVNTKLNDSLVKDGQSFLDALEKPTPPVILPLHIPPSQPQSNSPGDEVEIAPPPPDESGAKGVFKAPLPEKTTFLLLHLSLMRDYIDFEFQELKDKLETHPTIK